MSAMVERTCHCGKKFMAKKADVARGWARSCSKSCAAKAREKKLDRFGFQRDESGTFETRFRYPELHSEPYFTDAHLFSNEEHDCNKD